MRWLRLSVLAVLVLGAGYYTWQTFFGEQDRHYYGEKAEKAMAAKDWPLAAEHLENLLEVDPENDEGRWFLSVVYLRMNEKEGQELADIPETPQSLKLLKHLSKSAPTSEVNGRLLRHYVKTKQQSEAIAILPNLYQSKKGRAQATALASDLLAKSTDPEQSGQVLAVLEDNFAPTSLLLIRLKVSVLQKHDQKTELSDLIDQTLGRLASANLTTLDPLSPINMRMLSEILQGSLIYATDTKQAERRLLGSLNVLKRYGQTEEAAQYRIPLAEAAVGLSAIMEKSFPLPPPGRGSERTRQRILHDRRHRRDAARRILEFGLPLVKSGEATPIIYEYVARAAMQVEDNSRQIAIFREGLRLYGDLPSDLKDEVLDVHRDSALELIASGKMSEAAARSLDTASGTKPLGRLIAGFVAVEHGQLEAARQHVEEARKDETLTTPASLLESRIHLAAADWQAALDTVVPIEAGWEELSSTERVWITRSLGGRDELRLIIAFCHVQLKQYDEAGPLLDILAEGSYRPKARLLQLISLVRQEKWKEARVFAASAWQADSNNLALLLAEFIMRVRDGHSNIASSLLYQVSSLYPSDLRLRICLARWLATSGRTEQSLSLLRQTARQFPDDQVGPLIAAEMLLDRKREAELDAVLRDLNRPSTASAIVLLSAGMHLRKSRLDEAADALFEAAPGLPSAQEFALSSSVLATSRGHYRRAIDLLATTLGMPAPLRRGRSGFLEKLEEDIRDLHPRLVPPRIEALLKTFPDEPVLLLASARLAARRGHVKTALARLDQVQPLHSVPGQVEFMRAEFLHGARQMDEARTALDRVLAEVPKHNAAHLLAARLAWRQKDFEVALKHLDAVGTHAWSTEQLVFIRADSLRRLGRPLEAEPVYAELLKRDPMRGDVWHTVAEIQVASQRTAVALATLEAGLKHLPREVDLQERYLELLGENGQLEKMEFAVKRFSKGKPNLYRCLQLAEIHVSAGDMAAAERWLKQARSIAPGSVSDQLMFLEAVILHDKGRQTGRRSWYVQARDKYTRLLQVHPGHQQGFGNLAWLLLRRFDENQEAGELAHELLVNTKTDELTEPVLDTVVESLRQTSRTKRALELVESSLGRFPDSGALHFQHAALLYELSASDKEKEATAAKELQLAVAKGLPPHHQEEAAELRKFPP